MGTDPDVMEGLLRRVDTLLHPRGWHENAYGRLFGVVRERGGRLGAAPVRLDFDEARVPAPDALYALAQTAGHAFPTNAAGAAFSCEVYAHEYTEDMPVGLRDQVDAAVRNNELWRQPGRIEVRVVCAVLRDGTEGILTHQRDSDDIRVRVGPQAGRTFHGLRLLCGLPEEDTRDLPDWAKGSIAEGGDVTGPIGEPT